MKAVRLRAPLSFADGDRIIAAASAGDAARVVTLRGVALAAVHLRTGLRPKWIAALRWEAVTDSIASAYDEVESAWLETDRGPRPIAFHKAASVALAELWVAEGRPSTGAVFVGSRRPRAALTDRGIADLLAGWVNDAGFPHLDRRHMRAPFAGGCWPSRAGMSFACATPSVTSGFETSASSSWDWRKRRPRFRARRSSCLNPERILGGRAPRLRSRGRCSCSQPCFDAGGRRLRLAPRPPPASEARPGISPQSKPKNHGPGA